MPSSSSSSSRQSMTVSPSVSGKSSSISVSPSLSRPSQASGMLLASRGSEPAAISSSSV